MWNAIYQLVLIFYEYPYTVSAALQYIATAIIALLAILPREPLPPVKSRTLRIYGPVPKWRMPCYSPKERPQGLAA
jgi:hypothetical protein